MRSRLLQSSYCFTLGFMLLMSSEKVNAQKKDSLFIQGIPKAVHWENRPIAFKHEGSGIVLTAGEKTDMFRDPNVTYNTDNAPKLLFEADSNFVFSASIEHDFVNKWDGGALVIKKDSLNWIKLCFEKDYTGAKRVVSVVTKGISDDCNSVELNSNQIHFKIAKADNVITLYYSVNGKDWFLVRHFTFDSATLLRVGFLAQSPTGKECKVKFDNIRYVAKKIKDPYAGE